MIFLIERRGFDFLENHNPYVDETLGYVEQEEVAIAMIVRLNICKKRREYDGKYYPQFSYRPIVKMEP